MDDTDQSIDSTSYRIQNGNRNSTDISHNFRFGADYYLTPKITLSGSALYRFGQGKGLGDNRYRFLDENRALNDLRIRNTTEQEDEEAIDLTLGYRQTFAKKGQELTADIVYNTNVDNEISRFREA